jgi:surfactin synthase thioesterase subunit
MRRFLLGERADRCLITEFWNAVAANDTRTLQHRLTAIATLPAMRSEQIATPCIYLQASTDWLVPQCSVDAFRQRCKQLNIYQVAGTHFLLQSSPVECAQIIEGELQALLNFRT